MTTLDPPRTAQLYSGNEAIALGAWEAGVEVASAYPGTPSTEILESLVRYPEVDASWAPNEKVAVDVALGASLGGVRSLAVMKHVGLNVAADTFMTAAYTGVGAGMVIVSADDPGMHSSQNEQDNRYYARFAGVPLLEPSDSAEARDMMAVAFDISEKFDTPVLVRTTTRVSHNRSVVIPGDRMSRPGQGFHRDPSKYVMMPSNARRRRPVLLQRLADLSRFAEDCELTMEEGDDLSVGIVTSGISYHYVREILPRARIVKLGMTHPVPIARIRRFAAEVGRLIVVEELDPYLEDLLRSAGIEVEGKSLFPRAGELGPDQVRSGLAKAGIVEDTAPVIQSPQTVVRPPVLCPGCPHSGAYLNLRRLDAVVTGDIGCYTLAALRPLAAMDTCIAMGSSIGMAVGMAASGGAPGPVVATIGDSTFLHGGIQGLMDAVYNQADITVVILDNGTVAMTGGQEHPGTGTTLHGDPTRAVDLVGICQAVGVDDVTVVDPYDLAATFVALEEATRRTGPSVVITNRVCVESPVKVRDRPYEVIADRCTACQACMNLGCPSIAWTDELFEDRRKVTIDTATCTGCTMCAQLCAPAAIIPLEAANG